MGNSASTAAPAVATAPVARRTYVCHWNDLRRGQLIGIGHSSCGMASAPRVFTHFGIFLGHNRQEHNRMEVDGPAVVHYSSVGSRTGVRGEVRVSPLSDFIGEMTLADVFIEPDPGIFSPDEVVRRALSRLRERNWWLLSNNCEHFAQWAISGVGHSAQANRILRLHPAVPQLNARAHDTYMRAKDKLRRARHHFRYLM